MKTEFIDMCRILTEFDESIWKNHQDYEGFVMKNDIGLPLAYLNTHGLAIPTKEGVEFVERTWVDFLITADVKDKGFTELDEIIGKG